MRKILSLVLGLLWALPVWGANCNLFDISQSPTTENISSNLIWTRYNINVSSTSLSVGNWTAKHTDFISPGTYTITFNGTNSSVTIRGYDGSNLSVLRRGNGSFTITNPTQIWIFVADPETMARMTEIMLEQGSTATPYQPYNATCDDRCKNLFDKNASYALFDGYIKNADVGQNTTLNAYDGGDKTIIIKVAPNTTYTVTRATNLGLKYDRIRCAAFTTLPVDGSTGVILYNIMNETQANATFTTLSDTQYVAINVRNSGTVGNDWTQFINAFQLEQGSTATEYVPYNAACHNNKITIATTKYNETAFSPLNTALQNAISVVDTVVSNTITQAASIATLQAQKQTRPNDIADDNEKCPAGKKCLLVEDASGIPHWYEIVERYSRLPDGYTELQWIESTGSQWVNTEYKMTSDIVEYGIEIYGAPTSATSLFGSETSDAIQYSGVPYSSGSSVSVFIGRSSALGGVSFPASQWNTYTIKTTSATNLSVTLNGDTRDYVYSGGIQKEKPLYLFANNNFSNTQKASIRVRSFYIKDNGALVRDFVPAQNSDGKIGMYDLANGVFYENAGDGEFVAGPVAE